MLEDEQPDKVQVTLADGSQIVLEQPVIAGDTLTGSVDGEQRSIPLANVSALELREGDAVKTTLAIVGGVVLVGGLFLAVAAIIVCGGGDC